LRMLTITITIERGTSDAGAIHIHPGGRGFWVARSPTAAPRAWQRPARVPSFGRRQGGH
jgi:hypothetical protein